jgi:RNA polymerase sigma-70 factor (ECF subfamily)
MSEKMCVDVTLPGKKESIMGDGADSTRSVCAAWAVLLQKARAGDHAALNELAGEVRPELAAIAKKALPKRKGGKDDASDVVQESLLAICRNIGNFRGTTEAEFRAWLRAIVRNKARDVQRYDHQPGRDENRKQALPEDSSGAVMLAAGTSSPSQQATRREEEARREEALKRLPADAQEVIRLHFHEERDWPEIAREMERSEAAVKRLYFRAVRRWRESSGGSP